MKYSEYELVSEIKNNNHESLEYLIREYGRIVYFLAYTILKPFAAKEDVEECVSDVFFEALVKINEYDEAKGGFRNWLLIITKYKALTYRRKYNKRAEINIDDIQAASPVSVEQQTIDREEQKKIVNVINSFNKTDKGLFMRRYFYGERINDLMIAFNLSRDAVDSRLKRGKKLIKEALFNG